MAVFASTLIVVSSAAAGAVSSLALVLPLGVAFSVAITGGRHSG